MAEFRTKSFSSRPSRQFGRPGGSSSGGGQRPQRSGGRGRKKDYIHPSKFVKEAKIVEQVDEYVPNNAFADFDVHEVLKRNIVAKGFTHPTPIQDQTIPLGLAGSDVVGIANTGTGKTAAFAIPVLQKLMHDKNARAIIMAPTRELAMQIEQECREIAKGSGLSGVLLIGGVPMGPQLRSLKMRPPIVIGTPGRIKDHMRQGTLDVSKINVVVLDEVDRMLDMGFIGDITDILSETHVDKQSFFFSATMEPKVRGIIDRFSTDAVNVTVKTGDTSDNVHQDVIAYTSTGDKTTKLHDLLLSSGVEKTLIFDDTQRSVERLSEDLMARGFKCESIHGGKSQGQRQRALKKFRDNQIDILVATDVAARGIDVPGVTHVINYNQPQSYEDYVHRIGRAGRAGRVGYALTFIEKTY